MNPENAPHLEEWMNATEVAEFLGLSRQSVSVMMQREQFKTLHTFGTAKKPQLVVRRSEVEAFKEARGNKAEGTPEEG